MDIVYENAADYVARWQVVGPRLAAIARHELQELTPSQHLRQIRTVLELADHSLPLRLSSGLVQLQQRLHRQNHD